MVVCTLLYVAGTMHNVIIEGDVIHSRSPYDMEGFHCYVHCSIDCFQLPCVCHLFEVEPIAFFV